MSRISPLHRKSESSDCHYLGNISAVHSAQIGWIPYYEHRACLNKPDSWNYTTPRRLWDVKREKKNKTKDVVACLLVVAAVICPLYSCTVHTGNGVHWHTYSKSIGTSPPWENGGGQGRLSSKVHRSYFGVFRKHCSNELWSLVYASISGYCLLVNFSFRSWICDVWQLPTLQVFY